MLPWGSVIVITGSSVLAAEAPPPAGGFSDSLVVAAGTVLVAIVGGIVSVTIALINTRNRTDPAPPPATTTPATGSDLRDLTRRADDNDERDDVQDRRHNRTERDVDHLTERVVRLEEHHDRETPGWRRRHEP